VDKPYTIYAEIDDHKLATEFKATLERERRSMKAVVEVALQEYIARSKAKHAAEQAAKLAA
jgi:hypothetical protein